MVAFYLDEDVAEEVASLLADRGHFVTTTRRERRKGAPDPRQLLFAAGRGWILVTSNRHDYELLHDAWLMWSHEWRVSHLHTGILVVQQPRPGSVTLDMIADALHAFVRDAPDAGLPNGLHEWSRSNGWRRWPR